MSDLKKEAERRLHRVQLVPHCSVHGLVCQTQQVFQQTVLKSRQRAQLGTGTVSTLVWEKGTWGHLLTEAMAVRHKLQLVMSRQFLQPADFQALPSSRDYIAWQKKAGKMLLPHDFSLVDTFCRVPVPKENSEIKAVDERVKPAPSRSEGGSCGENPETSGFL